MSDADTGHERFAWAELSAFSEHANADTTNRWAHYGVATTADGGIITPDASGRSILILAADGSLRSRWPCTATNPHGITVEAEGPAVYVWIADNGYVRMRDHRGVYAKRPEPPIRGRVTCHTIAGDVVRVLGEPPTVGSGDDYSPTDVVADTVAVRPGVWVSDGYGQHLVHRFDMSGAYRFTIDGTEGAGRFRQPHSIYLDTRAEPRLLVADRANNRIQMFDHNSGRYLGCIGEDFLARPSGLALWGELLAVAELDGRVSLVDIKGELVERIAAAPESVSTRPGWPNALDADALDIRPELRPGEFNSPHAVAVTSSHHLVVSEWVIGGRLVQLAHVRGCEGDGVAPRDSRHDVRRSSCSKAKPNGSFFGEDRPSSGRNDGSREA